MDAAGRVSFRACTRSRLSLSKITLAVRMTILSPIRSPKRAQWLYTERPVVGCKSDALRPQRSVRAFHGNALKVSQDRLMNDIHHTAQWGPGERWGEAETETGMSRLTLSDTDKQARDWFAETTRSLGCNLTIDEMGNMFAVRPGKRQGPATFAGSHLDTQPTGGRYDGILGVTAAVEMLRVLQDDKVETEYDVGVVNWTNEEGARFPISMVSSGVWSGEITLEKAHNLASVVRGDNSTMLSELERIGYKGDLPCSYESMPMAAHFELHIEQGPTLENENRKIGIVEGVQAYRWFTIEVKGKDSHTGTTALHSRSDALLATSLIITRARLQAHAHAGLATVGIIEASPGSVNTIPGHVRFSLDVRATTNETRDAIVSALSADMSRIARGDIAELDPVLAAAYPDTVTVDVQQTSQSDAVLFHDDCVACVRAGAEDMFGARTGDVTRMMTSGAGHDSVYTSRRCPTSMLFVPSREGISHNPREYTRPEDCAVGAQVLMNAVLRYDRLRAERGD